MLCISYFVSTVYIRVVHLIYKYIYLDIYVNTTGPKWSMKNTTPGLQKEDEHY